MQGLPGFTAEVTCNSSLREQGYVVESPVDAFNESDRIILQGCGVFKAIACAATLAACGVGCVVGGPGWPICMAGCLSAAGAAGCIDCLE